MGQGVAVIIDPTLPLLHVIGDRTTGRMIVAVYGTEEGRERQVQAETPDGRMVPGTEVLSVSAAEYDRLRNAWAQEPTESHGAQRALMLLFGKTPYGRRAKAPETYGERTRAGF